MDSKFELYPHQQEALTHLKVGSILHGGVGSGKTLTSLAYYKQSYFDKDLIVITTAKKRDSGDWTAEAKLLGIQNLTVDSWNNIKNYSNVLNAFFIFDEQRASGYGKWSKMFIKISKNNPWILLSATPGDTWMDYIPVFIANGFYRNKTEFIERHVEYDRFAKFPKVKAYHNQPVLLKHKQDILVEMPVARTTVRHRRYISCDYDRKMYKRVLNDRWNVFEDKPVETPSEYVQCLRRVVNGSESRSNALRFILETTDRNIIFYNYKYELAILREICDELDKPYSEWNGEKHEAIPYGNEWTYLVQYTAGAEGWNCVETNSVIFYSLNYSYRATEQSEGRIDRINTRYKHLEYTYFMSDSSVDRSIRRAQINKETFNEMRWADGIGKRIPRWTD